MLAIWDVEALKGLGFKVANYDGQEGVFLVYRSELPEHLNATNVTEILPDGRVQRCSISFDEDGNGTTLDHDGPVSIYSALGQSIMVRR